MAKIPVVGGGFCDLQGNPLCKLRLRLSQDAQWTVRQGPFGSLLRLGSQGQVGAGVEASLALDGSGNVAGSQYMVPNDQLNPNDTTYTVWGYNASGQIVWGPVHALTIVGSVFNLGSWLGSWIPEV
jgi:hypothetical protein